MFATFVSGLASKPKTVSKRRPDLISKTPSSFASKPKTMSKPRPDLVSKTPSNKDGIVGVAGVQEDFTQAYEIGKLAQGGHDGKIDVMYGKRRRDGAAVVVKEFHRHRNSRRAEDDFRNTAEYLLRLPRIKGLCMTHDVYETPSSIFLVMERCAGNDVFEHLSNKKLKHEEQIRSIMVQLLQTMHDLHASGRIHKDLKLKNLVVDLSSAQCLTKVIDLDTVVDYTPGMTASIVLGSDGYIAPEAYEGKYSPASDVYSMGVILYRMFTLKFPHPMHIFDDRPGQNFVGSVDMTRVSRRIRSTPIDFARSPLDTLPKVASLLRGMLHYNPERRFTTEDALKHPWLNSPPASEALYQKGQPASTVWAASTCDTLPDFPVEDDLDSDLESN